LFILPGLILLQPQNQTLFFICTMILKKRDLYIFLILLSLVGYAACQRISERSVNSKEQIQQATTVQCETVPVSQSSGQNDANAPVLR
jgi:uncharacterized membrane protein